MILGIGFPPWEPFLSTGKRIGKRRLKRTRYMDQIIYKIVPADLWRQAEGNGIFTGASIDLTDGFIHFSTADQVRRTAELFFGGQDGLLLVAVDGRALDKLVFEPSRDGGLFPHLYGPLSLTDVLWVKPMPLSADGLHIFPEEIA
jgi:uncharacterized protein (DUF952 family)